VAAVEDHGEPLELEVERLRRLRRGVEVEELRETELHEGQQLRHTDRGDGEDEARRVLEAADDPDLDQEAGEDGRGEADHDRHPEVELPADDQRCRQHARHRAHVALGEVDDSVGAVHEHEAHRHERRERSGDDAEEQDGRRRRVQDADEHRHREHQRARPSGSHDLRALHRSPTIVPTIWLTTSSVREETLSVVLNPPFVRCKSSRGARAWT
jgi:hypothetical protein